jgi:hypothetical protein
MKTRWIICRNMRVVAAFAQVVLVALTLRAWAVPVSITHLGAPYSEHFDSLAANGTGTTVPAGWTFAESAANANASYTAGTGSSHTGDTYSFGATGSTERAFGGLRSGSLVPLIGVEFLNHTGGMITALRVNYVGEQWRLGTAGRTDRLDFQYRVTADSPVEGQWVDVNELDFIALVTTGPVGALNGNLSGNRVPISHTIDGLAVRPGDTIGLRWVDLDASGADDGLAVDDFSLTAFGVPFAVPDGLPAAIGLCLVLGIPILSRRTWQKGT